MICCGELRRFPRRLIRAKFGIITGRESDGTPNFYFHWNQCKQLDSGAFNIEGCP
jgi:hypothetical protein